MTRPFEDETADDLRTAFRDAIDTAVLDGRFRGGYITRRYGQPDEGVHAVQLELAQRTYMNEDYPYSLDDGLASELRPVLNELLHVAVDWVGSDPPRPSA